MKIILLVVVTLSLLVFLRLLLLSMKRGSQSPPPLQRRTGITLEGMQTSEVTQPSPARSAPASGRLAGKVALITGAGTGIGRACAIAFAREGAKVALMGRRREPLETLAQEIGAAALVCQGDVSNADDIIRIVRETTERFGGLNIVVNNAGKLSPGTADSQSEADWDATFDTNVRGVWLLSREALPHMRRAGRGSIINIASVLGLVGAKNRVAYAASKGAVTLLTRSMALDHAHEQVRVNAICPAIVDTDLVAHFIHSAPDPEAMRKQRVALHPLGRFGTPEDIAHAAVYLASDESSWVTGTAIPVDGGYSAV